MIGYENGAAVEAIDFQFPDEGDEPTPVVRDAWRAEPLLDKCQRRFAPVAGGQVTTMPLLDKRLEVLRYALAAAVEKMDVPAICRLAGKAKDTVERSEAERCAEASPSLRELHGDIVILDDADRGKVIIHFPAPPDQRTRRWLKMCGFFGAGDGGATWWRKRTFRRRENIALGSARHCVQRIIESREKIDAAEAAQFQRETAHSLCA